MTDDFRAGLFAGFARVIEMIQDTLKHSDLTPETAQPLQMLAEDVRLEMNEAER